MVFPNTTAIARHTKLWGRHVFAIEALFENTMNGVVNTTYKDHDMQKLPVCPGA